MLNGFHKLRAGSRCYILDFVMGHPERQLIENKDKGERPMDLVYCIGGIYTLVYLALSMVAN